MRKVIGLLLLVLASAGCKDDGLVGPQRTGADLVVFGALADDVNGGEAEIQLRITFQSIDLVRETTRDGFATRDIITGPASVSVLVGGNEFLDAAATLLESNPVRMRYGATPDGECRLSASMVVRDPISGDAFSFNMNASYEGYSSYRRQSLDNVSRASGIVLIQGTRNGEQRRFSSRGMNVSVRNMRSLISEAR